MYAAVLQAANADGEHSRARPGWVWQQQLHVHLPCVYVVSLMPQCAEHVP